jgi:EmrB/QacA subfamily drug resistance transporter
MTSKQWTLVAAVVGSGIVFLDSTIVNVALPKMGEQLPAHMVGVLEGQSYIYNGYLLTLSALLILAGALTDYHGRRRMFIVGLAGFGFTSVLCGLATSMELLIICRIFQGAAGAFLVPGSLSLITATFAGEEQARAFGIWAGASSGTTILGPFLGGILVDTISWRMAFLINIPLVLFAVWATARYVKESRDERASGSFDWAGALVCALGVGGLAFGAIYGEQHAWRDPLAFVALAVGIVAVIVLPIQMTRSPHPLVPLELFRSRNFTVTNLSTFVIYGALYVTFYYLTLFLQGTLGYTAAAVGLATMPGTLIFVILSSWFGTLGGRYGPRWFMALGPAIMSLGVLWLARVPANSAGWMFTPHVPSSYLPPHSYLTDFLPGSLIFGLGLTVMVAPLTTALMRSVPVQNAGVASAINNAISRVGPQLAGAAIFVAITASFYSGLAARVPGLDPTSERLRRQIAPLNRPAEGVPPSLATAARAVSTDALHLAMKISAALLLSGAVINAVGIQQQRPNR